MYYNGDKTVIEAGDIEAALSEKTVLTLPDGRQALVVALVVSPHADKSYRPGEFPVALHVTDGVNPRMLPFGAFPGSGGAVALEAVDCAPDDAADTAADAPDTSPAPDSAALTPDADPPTAL